MNNRPAGEPGIDSPTDQPPSSDQPPAGNPPRGPAGSGIFSLEGRPAAGLYFIGWLFSVVGVGLLLVAIQVGPPAGGVLLMASLLLVPIGLSSAAGYQIVRRAMRPPEAFRGPSPLLVFGVQVVAVNIVALLFLIIHVASTDDPVGFLITTLVLLCGYVAVVWLFGVRSGALAWSDLGIPGRVSAARVAGDVGLGVFVMIFVALAATLWAGLIATLLGTTAPHVVPPPETAGALLLIALGAGVVIPIGEELFFRGYSLTAWLRDLGPRSALIRSTVFFAVVHIATITSTTFIDGAKQAVLVVAVIGPVGLTLGWLFLRRGLIASIAGHATFNLVGVLLMALAQSLAPR